MVVALIASAAIVVILWDSPPYPDEFAEVTGRESHRNSHSFPQENLRIRNRMNQQQATDSSVVLTADRLHDSAQKRFDESFEVACATGNFAALKEFISEVNADKRPYFINRLSRAFSKLGPRHDIEEKLRIIEASNVSADDSIYLRRLILQREASQRFEQMEREGIVETLDERDFSDVCHSIAESRPSRAFAVAHHGRSEEGIRMASRAIARCAIRGGVMGASKEILGLRDGIVRDEAAAELVLWLNNAGSQEEAAAWLATIADDTARSRAMEKHQP